MVEIIAGLQRMFTRGDTNGESALARAVCRLPRSSMKIRFEPIARRLSATLL
jgi:hypothetical protein